MPEYRQVIGLYRKYYTNEPLANATIIIRLLTNSFTLEAGYPTTKTPGIVNDPGFSVQTDENGNLPDGLELFCSGANIGGGTKYRVTEPDGFEWDFILDYGDGTPISMQTLRAGGLPASSPDTTNALIENKLSAAAVRFDVEQVLTEPQKAKARANIGVTPGGVTGLGTAGKLTKFTDSTTVGDSSISETSSLVTVSNRGLKVIPPDADTPAFYAEHAGTTTSQRYIHIRDDSKDLFEVHGAGIFGAAASVGGGMQIRYNASGRGLQIASSTNSVWLEGVLRYKYFQKTLTANEDGMTVSASMFGRYINLNANADYYIGGLAWSVSGNPRESGNVISLINASEYNITLKHEHLAQATVSYRFLTVDGSDLVLAPNERAEIVYDGYVQRFRVWKF